MFCGLSGILAFLWFLLVFLAFVVVLDKTKLFMLIVFFLAESDSGNLQLQFSKQICSYLVRGCCWEVWGNVGGICWMSSGWLLGHVWEILCGTLKGCCIVVRKVVHRLKYYKTPMDKAI